MDLISDILLICGAFGLALYCLTLSRRLQALGRSDAGLGATIEALSDRVDQLTQAAGKATADAEAAAGRLGKLTEEARRREGELAFLLAGMGDESIDEGADEVAPPAKPAEPRFSSRFKEVDA